MISQLTDLKIIINKGGGGGRADNAKAYHSFVDGDKTMQLCQCIPGCTWLYISVVLKASTITVEALH